MKSYKLIVFSLLPLLSSPLSTLCMEGIDVDITPIPQNISSAGPNSEPSSPFSDATRLKTNQLDDDDDDASSLYYTPRQSIEYTGLEDFDTRSCDIAQDESYKTLITAINQNVNTPPPSPSLLTVQNGAFAGAAAATIYSIVQNSASIMSKVRNTPINNQKSMFPIIATQTATNILSNNASSIFGLVTITVLFAEMRKTAYLENDKKRLSGMVKTQQEYIDRLIQTVKKHEKIEHGLIGTEHDLLLKLHKNVADVAQEISKSKLACATCKSTQGKLNKKIITPLIDAMADLERIHNKAEDLLKDKKEYSALDPRGWFQAIKDMCHKHKHVDPSAEQR